MDIQENQPTPEVPSGDKKSRESTRPANAGRDNRNRRPRENREGSSPRNESPSTGNAALSPDSNAVSGAGNAPAGADRPGDNAGGKKAPRQNTRPHQGKPASRRNTPQRNPAGQNSPRKNPAPKNPRKGESDRTDAPPRAQNREDTARRSAGQAHAHPEPADRRRPSRPERTIHPARQADLPDMDRLLIDDWSAAENEPDDSLSDPDEIERILQYDIFQAQKEAAGSWKVPEVIPEGKAVITGIRFRSGGKTYFFDPGQLDCRVGDYAIVETARGPELGEVCLANRLVRQSVIVPPLRPVLRIATEADMAHHAENRQREKNAFRIALEKIADHKLDMKLVSAQYTFDNSKLLFYFTSAGRVDFRELVKDLAGVFHIRIELRQIGIRDEARMIGGLGACGRPLCCNAFLSDCGQVSMKMAKEQNLSLNSTKISGYCGRLMCCLRYEHETYVNEIRRMPPVGTAVRTPDGNGVVTEIIPLSGEVKVNLFQSDVPPKKYKREVLSPLDADTGNTENTRTDTSEPGNAKTPGTQAAGRDTGRRMPKPEATAEEYGEPDGEPNGEPDGEPDSDE